jgi:hypothetical protein
MMVMIIAVLLITAKMKHYYNSNKSVHSRRKYYYYHLKLYDTKYFNENLYDPASGYIKRAIILYYFYYCVMNTKITYEYFKRPYSPANLVLGAKIE